MAKSIKNLLHGAGLSTVGSFSTAGANFVYSLAIIPVLTKEEYGIYSFSLLVTQLFFNISNALTATPMSIELATYQRGENAFSAYTLTSIFLSIIAATAVLANAVFLLASASAALPITLFTFVATLRWYGRTFFFTVSKRHVVATSDVTYSITLCVFSAIAFLQERASFAEVGMYVFMSSIFGFIPICQKEFINSASKMRLSLLIYYYKIFKAHSSWALVSAIVSEITVNCHVYLVIYSHGPQAYAPLAVAALFWRPMSTVISSLAQSERPHIARLLARAHTGELFTALHRLHQILLIAYLINAVVVVMAFVFFSRFLPQKYDVSILAIAATFWAAMMLARTIRVPETVLSQAGSALKEVALLGRFSAPLSLIFAAGLLYGFNEPVWSLAGVMIGDIFLMAGTIRISRRLRRSLTANLGREQSER